MRSACSSGGAVPGGRRPEWPRSIRARTRAAAGEEGEKAAAAAAPRRHRGRAAGALADLGIKYLERAVTLQPRVPRSDGVPQPSRAAEGDRRSSRTRTRYQAAIRRRRELGGTRPEARALAMAFEAFLDAARPAAAGPACRRRITLTVSLAVHVAALLVGIAYSFWHVDELPLPAVSVTLAGRAAAPAAAARAPPKRQDPARSVEHAEAALVQPKEHPKDAQPEKPAPDEKDDPHGRGGRRERRRPGRRRSGRRGRAGSEHRAQDADARRSARGCCSSTPTRSNTV